MRHLTPDEIERFADERRAPAPGGACAEHLGRCVRCQEDVDMLRSLILALVSLPRAVPSEGFTEAVMARIDLPIAALDRELARLGHLAPSAAFADSVLTRVDLPMPALDHALAGLRHFSPSPGFATAVAARVQLPVAWHERLWQFARQQRTALASTAAGTVAVMAGVGAWVFGIQGVSPAQLFAFVLGGARSVALEGLLAAGRLGYRFGLVDSSGSVADYINPMTALGSLGLASVLGLTSLWVMARLFRAPPRAVAFAKAA